MKGVGRAKRLVVLTTLALTAGLAFAATAMATHVSPVFIAGNDEFNGCANAAAAAGLSGSWAGLKIDGQPANGSYTSGPLTVTISGATSSSFNWSSNIGLGAVFVKAGNGANYYAYSNATADTGLQSPEGKGISHVLFCYPARLVVSKTATPSFKRTHTWDVEKMANPTAQTVNVGSSGSTSWTVVLDERSTESEWTVAGTITVTNASSTSTVVNLTDNLAGATVVLEPGCSSFTLAGGASVECDYTATYASDPGDGTLTNTANADAVESSVGDASGSASFSFANASVTEVNAQVALADGQAPAGSFSNPYTGDATITYPKSYPCSSAGTQTITNTATVSPHGGGAALDQDTATYTLTCQTQGSPPPPTVVQTTPTIDLSINKVDTPDPLAVNGTLTYTISVRNNGPDGATNVTVTDPIPAAMVYLSATASQGSCTGGQSLSCNLGSLANGASATITVTVRASQAGTFTNTATVKGDQQEPNTANNTASAQTTVTAPLTPPAPTPKPKPKPKPAPAVCYAFTVSAKSVPAGQTRTLVVRVSLRGKAVRNAKVLVRGPGVSKSARTNARGIARISVRASRPGILRISVASKAACTSKRVGVVGAFEPPVTG